MAAWINIRKAGLLAGPAFLLAGCEGVLQKSAGDDFFAASSGGDPVAVQHIIWFIGHPEIFIPLIVIAIGLILTAIAIFFPKLGEAVWRAVKWPPSISVLWVWSGLIVLIEGAIAVFAMMTKDIPVSSDHTYYVVEALKSVFLIASIFFIAALIFKVLPKLMRFSYNIWLGRLTIILSLSAALLVTIAINFFNVLGLLRSGSSKETALDLLENFSDFSNILWLLALATFVILVIEALVVRRPLRDKPADPTLDAFE